MRWLGGLLLLGFLAAPVMGQPKINEIRIDQPGTDNDEYFELYMPGGGPLTNYWYIVIGDGNDVDSSGVVEYALNLGLQTVPADGFFLVAENTFTFSETPDLVTNLNFENGDNVTHMLVTNFTGANGEDLDTNDDGTFDITPWSSIVDVVAIIKEPNPPSTTEYHYGRNPSEIVGPDGTFVPGQVYRVTDGTGAWQVGQFEIPGGNDTPGVSNTSFPPPDAIGKVTITQVNTTTGTIDLCKTGSDTPLSSVITGLAAHGTLKDGATTITAGMLPHTLAGSLTYVPDTNYSGLDTFEFEAMDNGSQLSDPATQEVAVQATSDVFISEIMHAPIGSQDIYEFVEIYNKGNSAVDLTRLDTRSAEAGSEKDTTDNLLGASIPAHSVRILAPYDATAPDGAVDFRCNWQIDESLIIRVPLDAWEQMFQAADPNCYASQGSRVLLFGTGDVLLDAVNLDLQSGLNDCTGAEIGSYTLNPLIPAPIDNVANDNPLRWTCATNESFGPSDTRVGADNNDLSTITSVVFEKPAFTAPVPCLRGSCCTRSGGCVENVFEDQCIDLTCQTGFGSDVLGLWHEGETCDVSSCGDIVAPALQDPIKCCLPGPAGLCQDLTDCECARVNGFSDSENTCESAPFCPATDGIVFNELDYDQQGTDTLEFVELLGQTSGGFDLSGYTLEFHNGDASSNALTLITSRTVYIDAELGGAGFPDDGGGLGYLVLGDFGVPNLDIDLCDPPGASCSNRIENGGSVAGDKGDGIVLLNNGIVVEAIGYGGTTGGFVARGGAADGTFIPDIGVVDSVYGDLQRLPDGQTWTETPNITPGATNVAAGACCSGAEGKTCTIVEGADACTNGLGGTYHGDLTYCDPINPCVPRGACCLPNGSCLPDVTSNSCELQGGVWNGLGTSCPDVAGFVGCVSGPGNSAGPSCSAFDYGIQDSDVDLADYWEFQRQDFCLPAPIGACCRADGVCEINNQFDCEAFAGVYQGDGTSCSPDPGCTPIAGDVLINELLANEDGDDNNEFVELFGSPNASLDGLSLIIVDGDTGDAGAASGQYRAVTVWADLDGLSLNGSGYLVLGNGPSVASDVNLESTFVSGFGSTNGLPDDIQNGSQTYAIVATTDIALDGDQLTDESVAAINAHAVDAVATLDGSSGDQTYFNAPVVTSLDGRTMAYGQRIPNGTDTNTAADWEVLNSVEFGAVGSPTSPTFDAPNVAIMGACCDGATCSQTTYAGCGFTFFGYNTPCSPTNSCVGACCTPSLTCSEVAEGDCADPNAYLGGGTTCGANSCVACTDLATAEMEADGSGVCVTRVLINTLYDTVSSTSVADFTVQDEFGTNGITVFGDQATEIPGLLAGASKGDLLEIRGELATYYQSRELVTGTVQLSAINLGPGNLVPFDRTIASLQGVAAADSPINNVLVRITGVQFQNAGGTFTAGSDNTILDAGNPSLTLNCRINNSNNPPPIVNTTIPSGTVNVVGVIKAFSSEFEITIFEPGDIQ